MPSLRVLVWFVLLSACTGAQGPTSLPSSTAAPSAQSGPLESVSLADLSRWAAAICVPLDEFEEAIAPRDSVIDPTTLTVRERVARAQRDAPVRIAAADKAAAVLRSIHPPTGTAEFHDALRNYFAEIGRVQAEQNYSPMTLAVEIETANSAVQIAVARAWTAVSVEAKILAPDVIAAIQGVTHCGVLKA